MRKRYYSKRLGLVNKSELKKHCDNKILATNAKEQVNFFLLFTFMIFKMYLLLFFVPLLLFFSLFFLTFYVVSYRNNMYSFKLTYLQAKHNRGLTQAVFLHLRLRHATLNISKNIRYLAFAPCGRETEEVERWDRVAKHVSTRTSWIFTFLKLVENNNKYYYYSKNFRF